MLIIGKAFGCGEWVDVVLKIEENRIVEVYADVVSSEENKKKMKEIKKYLRGKKLDKDLKNEIEKMLKEHTLILKALRDALDKA